MASYFTFWAAVNILATFADQLGGPWHQLKNLKSLQQVTNI